MFHYRILHFEVSIQGSLFSLKLIPIIYSKTTEKALSITLHQSFLKGLSL